MTQPLLGVALLTQRVATGIPCVTAAELPAKIQEVLAALEYANGPVTSAWGAKRAAAGHPAPFGITHIGLGNEACGVPNAVGFEPAENSLDWNRPEAERWDRRRAGGLPRCGLRRGVFCLLPRGQREVPGRHADRGDRSALQPPRPLGSGRPLR